MKKRLKISVRRKDSKQRPLQEQLLCRLLLLQLLKRLRPRNILTRLKNLS